MHNYPYNQPVQARPDTWSTLTITYKNRDPVSRNLRATPSLLKHLLMEARETGWLYIFDDVTAEAIPFDSDEIESISMVKITTD